MKKIFLLPFAFFLLPGAVASAQSSPPTCQPPPQGEYLVLVGSQTRESQEQIQRTLPNNTSTSTCKYLEDTMTRIGGFRSVEDANGWARYLNEIVGLSAFVLRPPEAPANPNAPTYKPQALGAGYAVLVDYSSKPEVAAQVRQMLGRDVGLVSYAQRPYLLAVYTTNSNEANSALRRLSDRGFLVMLVDSRRVTLLRSSVVSK
ncbi:hypothetical protein [Coleofasciculus sp. FACHB-SPT36]|uniref:hypothetical protein n=1 Tax=Cyanophyceae TaxID=3028117 RepID=UPI00168A7E4B|nr:hypothetical protein [Coleofasciculus sp. FACHB-SPT36]MBD2541094.1 hypothetical protein [Coleofasciculus sp. FACHB-SPT36]